MPKKRKTDKSTIISFIHTFSPVSFYFILLASPKKKKTNKQTNRKNFGRDTATAVANYSGPGCFTWLQKDPGHGFPYYCKALRVSF